MYKNVKNNKWPNTAKFMQFLKQNILRIFFIKWQKNINIKETIKLPSRLGFLNSSWLKMTTPVSQEHVS